MRVVQGPSTRYEPVRREFCCLYHNPWLQVAVDVRGKDEGKGYQTDCSTGFLLCGSL
jgi:hypothetical protein